jgi:hypothetical protein
VLALYVGFVLIVCWGVGRVARREDEQPPSAGAERGASLRRPPTPSPAGA